ncbi:hypothetical protein TNCV_275131 [Trichonephila clavipes]|nr:hypothetical protein TNCV_275131 [Trichonephila clavipes]
MDLRNKDGVMKKMPRCFTRILAPSHSPLAGSAFVFSARIGLGRPRADFCDLPMIRVVGRGVDQPLVFKRGFFRREESPLKRDLERDGSRKRCQRLGERREPKEMSETLREWRRSEIELGGRGNLRDRTEERE